MPTNYITLTRQALYELVWSKPMSNLAKEFGITDVGLAKRCRAVDVPIPYRGYWASKSAGQDPPRLPLPKYRGAIAIRGAGAAPLTLPIPSEIVRDGVEPIVNFEPRPPRTEPVEAPSPPLSAREEEVRDTLITEPPTVADDLRRAHPAVKRTAVHLRAQRRKDLDWRRGERSGTLIEIRTSKLCQNRALRLADAVLKAAARLGWSFEEDPKPEQRERWNRYGGGYTPPNYGRLLVDGEPMRLVIDERSKQVPHVLTDYEKRWKAKGDDVHTRPWDLAPTGDLRLHLASVDDRKFETVKD